MLIPRSSYSILISSILLTFSLPAIFARDTVSSKTCSIQSDCESPNNELRDISTHGNGIYWCVQGTCRFVVGAAEPCSADVDCLSTHIASNTTNSTAPNTFCAPQFCTASSTCDAAWSRFDIPLPSSQSCCRSQVQNSQCVAATRTGINVCEAGQKCSGENSEGVRNGVCEPVNGKRFIWIGVILQLIGGVIVNIGLNVQKYGIKRRERAIEAERLRQHVSADNNDQSNTATPTHPSSDSADTDASQTPATPPTSALGRLRQRFRRNRGSEGHALSPSRESDEAHEEEKGALTFGMTLGNPLWLFGFAIFVLGNMSTFVALRFAPQSLVSPLGAISLVSNAVVAPIVNREVVRWTDLVGILLICGGAVIATVFAGAVHEGYKLCVLIALFRKPGNIAFMAVTGGAIISVWVFIRLVERRLRLAERAARRRQAERNAANAAQTSSSNENDNKPNEDGIKMEEISEDKATRRLSIDVVVEDLMVSNAGETSSHATVGTDHSTVPALRDADPERPPPYEAATANVHIIDRGGPIVRLALPFAYASIGGLLASLTVLFGKIIVYLLSETFVEGDNQFDSFESWIILIAALVAAVLQVYWINKGLQKFDAMIIVPIFYVVWSIFDILGGAIYFEEFANYNAVQYVLFLLGILLVFVGVLFLARRLNAGNVAI